MLIQSKQIKKLLASRVRVNAFAGGSSTSVVVTTAITTALASAGYGGGSVPVTPSSGESVTGIITTGSTNAVLIYTSSNKQPIVDNDGNEVYGRITEASSVYTLSYYSLVGGVETAYTAEGVNIDFEFAYRFDLKDLPTDSIISQKARNIADDPANQSGVYVTQVCTISGTNTVSNLSNTNIQTATAIFYINGQAILNTQGLATTTGGVVTVTPLTLGYSLETTDVLTASYYYNP
jgi:hypothetical protein